MGVAHLIDVEYDSSYYGYENRLEEGLDGLDECIERAEETDCLEKTELRHIRRIRYYVEEHMEDDDKSVSEIRSVVKIITNGLAKKVYEPDDFEGYTPEIEKHADMVGIQVRSRSV